MSLVNFGSAGVRLHRRQHAETVFGTEVGSDDGNIEDKGVTHNPSENTRKERHHAGVNANNNATPAPKMRALRHIRR